MNIEDIKIGKRVIYWSVIATENEKYYPSIVEVDSDCWLTGGGIPVCHLKGKAGGFCLTHLDEMTEDNLFKARLKGLIEEKEQL